MMRRAERRTTDRLESLIWDRTSDPAPGTPSYNPSWYANTNIYLDPVNGKDTNSGVSSSSALKTMSQVVQRYGSSTPQLVFGQSLTIHQLTAQTLNVDAFFFSPKCSGGGNYTWLATPTLVGAPFSPTSVTAKVQTAAGNDLILNGNLPVGAAPGQIVQNLTKGSSAKILSLAGGDATVTQPMANFAAVVAFPSLSEDNTWASTDSYQLSQPLLCNYKQVTAVGGDIDATITYGTYWIQGIEIADSSGANGNSVFAIDSPAIACVLWLCTFDPYVQATGSAYVMYFVSCTFRGGCNIAGPYMTIAGGSSVAGPDGNFTANEALIDCDFIVDSMTVYGGTVLGAVHVTTLLSVDQPGGGAIEPANTATAIVWGAGTGEVSGCQFRNRTNGLWANCLKLAALHLEGQTTASSFNSAASGNPYTAGITITSANLDTGGGAGNPGLQNPRTQSGYAST
jgi:hypothetical protein